ncbi:MAG TPA: hypothetical protein VFK30_03760, partial [Anaerolineae bacterium]|nr:hypothetical protein [Anaerolineae bacterium]
SMTDDEQTIVVVPSMSIDSDLKGAVLQAYEERFLFLLLLLRQPRARLIGWCCWCGRCRAGAD